MTKPEFAQPDLRITNSDGRGSSYAHPHTGERVPSVTTISTLIDKSSFLTPWGASTAAQWAANHMDELQSIRDPDVIMAAIKEGSEKIRHAGRDLGSLVHDTLEEIVKGAKVEIDPKVKHHIDGWLEFMEHYVEEILFVEMTVWSHRYKYAGTFDVICRFKTGEVVLVDYKTGAKVYDDAALQLNALARADVLITTAGERPMPKIDQLGVLHLPAPIMTPGGKESIRGKWSYREVPMREVEWETFLHLRAVYDWDHIYSKDAIGGKQTRPSQ